MTDEQITALTEELQRWRTERPPLFDAESNVRHVFAVQTDPVGSADFPEGRWIIFTASPTVP